MIRLNMFSSAEKVKGQGVASAYRELVNVIQSHLTSINMTMNKFRKADITLYHTIDFRFFLSTFLRHRLGIKIGYVHFLPETIDDSLSLPKPVQKLFYRYIILFYKRMDELIVVNPSFIPKLIAYGIEDDRIHYIPNFVSNKSFYPVNDKKEKQALRKEHGWSIDSFIVIGVGQVQYRKGVLDFIETAKRLPHLTFIWAGGFSFGKITAGYEELKQIYDHPPKNVHFIGIVDRDKMNTYYQMADMLFLPSYNELFPMTVLEAMNCQIPILLRDLDLYQSILDGYYLKASNVDEFVSLIRRLEGESAVYKEAVHRSKSGAAYYSEERVVKLWKDMYLTLHNRRQQHDQTKP
ncbi:glycosyltransferase [Terrilactibacillus sp. BCM23-1]|uniref:Glycosyltransferase n=1 Tax=Terrilactibacillus tamarindi TaxID=2599694 RepID=A0A6N8CMN9_9BACI|nr:glycosyltransferase family 4 protein [Terrilactibacillus tamarindi]MTT30790.1 glycosyltransferase [Terrilactibacillus tamarindi]